MPDNPTDLPPASWYPDPAGTPSERWWDGMQWSDHLRETPIAIAPVVPQYAFATEAVAPAPVIPQFAFATQESAPAPVIPQYAFAEHVEADPAPMIPSTAWNAGGGVYQPMASHQVAGAASFGMDFRPGPNAPVSNPAAIASLVFGVLAVVIPVVIPTILAWVFGGVGLRRARFADSQAQGPTGRAMSRWGIVLGFIGVAWITFLVVSAVTVFASQGYGYNATAIEKNIAAGFESTAGVPPASVECSDNGSYALGSTFECVLVSADGQSFTITGTGNGAFKEPTMEFHRTGE